MSTPAAPLAPVEDTAAVNPLPGGAAGSREQGTAVPALAPGVQSSEFLVAILAIIVITILLVAGKLTPNTAAVLLGGIFAGYPGLRTWLKARHLDAVADVLMSAHTDRADRLTDWLNSITPPAVLRPPAPSPLDPRPATPAETVIRDGIGGGVLRPLLLLLAVLSLAALGCAQLTVKDGATGRTKLAVQSNARHLEYHDGATSLVVDGLDNSTATEAGGRAFAQGVNAVGGAGTSLALGLGTSGLFKAGAAAASKSLAVPVAAVATQAISKPAAAPKSGSGQRPNGNPTQP